MRKDFNISNRIRGKKSIVKDFSTPILIVFAVLTLFSCRSSRNAEGSINFKEIAKAGNALNVYIDERDNRAFFLESASWLGVPYKFGGESKSGVDCSGLARAIYQNVFSLTLPRTSAKQFYTLNDRDEKYLYGGSLLFFTSPSSAGAPAHVGLYLKDGKFIHSSSSKGVIVSSLNEAYWKKNLIGYCFPVKRTASR